MLSQKFQTLSGGSCMRLFLGKCYCCQYSIMSASDQQVCIQYTQVSISDGNLVYCEASNTLDQGCNSYPYYPVILPFSMYPDLNTNVQFNEPLQVKHLKKYKRCTNDSSKSCKTQSTLHSFSRVCPLECATAITKRIAEFVAQDLRPISVVDGQGFTRLLN